MPPRGMLHCSHSKLRKGKPVATCRDYYRGNAASLSALKHGLPLCNQSMRKTKQDGASVVDLEADAKPKSVPTKVVLL